MYSFLSDEEQELRTYEKEEEELDEMLDDDDIDEYYKQFTDFIHAQLHKIYNLQSSRKRSRGKNQNEGTSSQEAPKLVDKGKGPSKMIIQNKKGSSHPKFHKPKAL